MWQPNVFQVVKEIQAPHSLGAARIVPVAFTLPQPPVRGMMYVNPPDPFGVPLTVIVFEAQEAVTPAGSPDGVPIPVAPVVVCVMDGMAVPMFTVGVEEAALAVLVCTVIVPVAWALPRPPVSGTL